MNTGLAMLVVTAVLAMMIRPQDSHEKKNTPKLRIECAKKNILAGIRSGNDGVTEAALMLAAKMKMKYPETHIDEVKMLLDSVSIAHVSEGMRYKAYLSSCVCSDPGWFAMDSSIAAADAETFYPRTAYRLQQKMFGLNTP